MHGFAHYFAVNFKMLRCLSVVQGKVDALSLFRRSFSTSLIKFGDADANKLLKGFHVAVKSTRNSSSRTMFVRHSRFLNEKFYDELVR